MINFRTKEEDIELQPLTTNEDEDSPHTRECRGELSRMARVRSDETSLDEEHSTSPAQPTTIGAGLPLLQRLKLLKEKQEKEGVERNIHVVEVQVLNEREPGVVDPGQHLLHRDHLVKQSEGTEREQRAIQTTASETAQVLASTVRTQLTSPFVLRPERSQEEGRSLIPNLRSPTPPSDSKETCRTRKHGGVSWKDSFGEEGNNQRHSVVDSSQTSKSGEGINADKSKNTPIINTTKISETKKLSEPSQQSFNLVSFDDLEALPLAENSGSQSFYERLSSSERLESSNSCNSSFRKSQDKKESITFAQDLKDAQINSISNDNNPNISSRYVSDDNSLCIGVSPSEDQPNYSREVRSLRERPLSLRFKDGKKMYKSIHDLSPECSDLPFVTRLKILHERQRNSNYEERTNLRSSSLDSVHNLKNKEPNQIYDITNLIRSNSESLLFEVILQNQQLRAQAKAAQHIEMEQTVQSPDSQVVSPESNETVERRKLKSILKKLSSTSLTASNSSTTPPEVLTASSTSSTELRKLMRAQTVEGYAARHTKLSKSVTFNRDTLESPPHEPTTNSQEPVFQFAKVHTSLDAAECAELDTPHHSKESLVTNVNLSESDTTSVSDNPKYYFAVETLDAGTQTTLGNSLPIGTPHSSMFEYAEGNDFPTGSCQHCSAPETHRGQSFVKSSDSAQRPQGNFVGRPQAKQKNFYRPGSVLLPTCAQEDEFFGGLLNGIKDIIKKHLVSKVVGSPSIFTYLTFVEIQPAFRKRIDTFVILS